MSDDETKRYSLYKEWQKDKPSLAIVMLCPSSSGELASNHCSGRESRLPGDGGGTGKAKNKLFQRRLEQVLTALRPYEKKLHCLCDETGGSRDLHPLSPRVREWQLSPMKINELLPEPPKATPEPKKKGRPKAAKEEPAQ